MIVREFNNIEVIIQTNKMDIKAIRIYLKWLYIEGVGGFEK